MSIRTLSYEMIAGCPSDGRYAHGCWEAGRSIPETSLSRLATSVYHLVISTVCTRLPEAMIDDVDICARVATCKGTVVMACWDEGRGQPQYISSKQRSD